MSLIGTCHKSGPSATAISIKPRMTALAAANRCRRNRAPVSKPGTGRSPRVRRSDRAQTGEDAGVEPAIEDVGNQIEQDDQTGEYKGDRHDHRRIVGED